MKKIFIIALSMLSYGGFAQQESQYSQYFLNNYIVNPAVAGVDDFTEIKLSARTQWVGLTDAPKSAYISATTPIDKVHAKVLRNRKPEGHSAIGASVLAQNTGPLSLYSAYASYAYHLPLGNGFMFSSGLAMGVKQFSVDKDRLYFGDNNATPDVVTGTLTQTKPDASVGFFLYNKRFYAGISSSQIFNNSMKLVTDPQSQTSTGSKLNRHYFICTGYRFTLNYDWDFTPSTMIKYVQNAPVQIDVNGKFKYQNLFWFGASYRKLDSFSAFAGVIFNDVLEVGYCYDLTTSKLNHFSYGSHEILVGLRIPKKGTIICPSSFW